MTIPITELNTRVREDPAGLVAECERDYAARVISAADAIEHNLPLSPIVLLSGPSGAGKTTTARRIEDELERRGIVTHTVSMDNYFITVDLRTAPRTPEGELDFESPDIVDMPLLNEHFEMLARGEEIRVPYFMFTRQKRSASQFTRLRLRENEVAIFEGIHALNDRITDRHPNAFGLYISPLTEYMAPDGAVFKPEWTRLCRRVVRDNNFRGSDAAYTLSLWANVMRGEREHITPFIHKARLRLDSSLPYEVPLLRDEALPLLSQLAEGMPGYEEIMSFVPILEQFASLDRALTPAESLLREFIGGGIYEY
ncbi:MAG: uridine kinase family protein [bacterium]